jgi:hypothetical protein
MKLLKFFDKYVELGLKPIAVYKDSKKPVCQGWNEDWSSDRWRDYFKTNDYNMGILLGDIVDVEGDTEEANDLLQRMIDGICCPKFRSSKSIHNLFLNPDPNLTRRVFNNIEFRGNRHQSVVPPSIHTEGNCYSWLEGSKFPIPPMPEELLNFYLKNCFEKPKQEQKQKPASRKIRIKDGHTKTHCNCCSNKYFIHKKRLMLEVRAFRNFNLKWLCRSCREIDLRESCREIRKELNRQDVHIE